MTLITTVPNRDTIQAAVTEDSHVFSFDEELVPRSLAGAAGGDGADGGDCENGGLDRRMSEMNLSEEAREHRRQEERRREAGRRAGCWRRTRGYAGGRRRRRSVSLQSWGA